MRTCGGDIAA